jgi:hypothetical protein
VDDVPIEVDVSPSFHGGTLSVPVTLDGAGHRIDVEWTGGLEPGPPLVDLEPGQPSAGLRIVDFGHEGDAWRLAVQGEAGDVHRVRTFGEPVRIRSVALPDEHGARTPGTAEVVSRREGTTEIEITMPVADADRSTMILHLEEAAP